MVRIATGTEKGQEIYAIALKLSFVVKVCQAG